ncbi:TIGR04388 family protein [Leptospira noguchii]|nr:TIGR04388 family protein [Leptospira noguchii]
MNVNTNFTNGLGLGLDYNFKSKDYTANASYDLNNIGGKKWANVNLGISASKSGHASFSASYNSDGNTHIPQSLRGGGATLDFGNDGKIGLSVQGMKGATIGTLTYDTNTHGFEPVSFNSNFQNEFNQGQAAENSSENHERNQMEILLKEISLGSKMDKPLFTQSEVDSALPRDGKGGIDMANAHPEKLLEKWNAHKDKMSQTPEGLQKWKEDVTKAGERSGIEVRFNEGKSATSTFGKFVTGLMGDVAQSFGFANDGSKMVDKRGVFHLDTCFAGDTSIRTETGLKAIESIVVGDVVQSWNETANQFENKRVTQVFVHEVPQLFFLELDGEEEIHTTWNHPFRRKITDKREEISPFDLRGVNRDIATHEHVMQPSVGITLEKRDAEETSQQTLTTNNSKSSHLTTNNSKAQTLTPSLTTRSEWVKVEDLKLRDQVLRSDGSWGTVTGIYYYNTEPTKVYNLEVEDNHTYVVGGDTLGIGYVVHNYEGSFDKGVAAIKAQVKGFMGGSGLFGLGPEHPMSGEAKALHDNLTHYDSEDKRLGGEKNQIATEGRRLEGQKELFFRKNDFLLGIVRDSSSNGVEGIADLRKSLANADPKRGFSKAEMSAIGDFMKKNFGNSNGLGMNFGGSGFTTGGMSNLIANGGIKSELLKAAGEAGSSGTLAHLNERLGANKEQLRLKTIEHEAAGAHLAKIITQDFEKFKVAASERHYNDANYSDFIARNQKSGIKLESPTTYMTNEGKKVQAEHQSKLEFIKKYGELDTHGSNGKVVAEQLLNSRERYIKEDLKREETANRLLNESPAYKEKRGIIERSGQEASRLQTELENRKTQLHLEGKTERQIASDADVKRLQSDFEKHTKLKETTKSEIETLYKNTLTKLDSKSVYGPEIYTAAIKTAERNPEYSENLKKITQMRDSKEMSTGGLFDKLALGLNLNRDVNEKIAFLEKRNSEIVDGYAKQELKLHDKESNRLGSSGLKDLDKETSKHLDGAIREIVNRNYDPETGLFKEGGPFAHLNNPKVVEEKLQMENNFNFGETKEKYQPNAQRMKKISENVISGYANAEVKNPKNNPKNMSINEIERVSALAFESPGDRFKRVYGEEYNANNVDHKIKLAKEMVSARNGNQSQFGPLAVQLSATYNNIIQESGGKKENFTPDPSLKPGTKEYKDFEKVRDWIFSGKNPMEMGNATSEALCRVFYNYNQALTTGKIPMNTNLSTFMTHKIRNGLVSMGVDNPAPVYDNGGTAGYGRSAKPETRLDNDFGRYLLDKKGNPLGMTGVMSQENIGNVLKDLPVGSVVQVFGDTRNPPGPNHYFFVIKSEDGLFRYFNNNSDEKEQKFGERINWKTMKVYGLYYD